MRTNTYRKGLLGPMYLFYLDLARLSVDIDLNYIGQVERQAMVSERPAIVKAVEQICGALGYQIQRGAGDHALVAWTLGYQNHAVAPITSRSKSTSCTVRAPSLQTFARLQDSATKQNARSQHWPSRNCWRAS